MLIAEQIQYTAAIVAGLLSFFSPCILPLVPSYFSFITGISIDKLDSTATVSAHRKIILSTLAFVLGFSVVFILLGATAAYFSFLLQAARIYLRIIGGLLVLLLGLHLLGILPIRALLVDKHMRIDRKPVHFFGTFLVGMGFGAGWSPCIGPLLGSILILAGNQDTVSQGILLLVLYSIGLALPFMVLSFAIHWLIRFTRRAAKAMRLINAASGVLLIVTGLLLITDKLQMLTYFAF